MTIVLKVHNIHTTAVHMLLQLQVMLFLLFASGVKDTEQGPEIFLLFFTFLWFEFFFFFFTKNKSEVIVLYKSCSDLNATRNKD